MDQTKSFFDQISALDTKSLKEITSDLPYHHGLDSVLHELGLGKNFFKQMADSFKKKLALHYYDSRFLDAQILHEIHNNQTIPTLFVCAGAFHTQNITRLLQETGYTFVNILVIGIMRLLREGQL